MAITLTDVARRLRELISALDRRLPRPEHAGEAAIARDAAVLREKAVSRLAEIAGQMTSAPGGTPEPVGRRGTRAMNSTVFPATPGDVAVLTLQEFTFDLGELDENRVPSMERVCLTFMDDTNRALVWWIRFGALKNWCARTDVIARLNSDSRTLRDASETAAAFPLNAQWEFDADDFRSALEAVGKKRARAGVDR